MNNKFFGAVILLFIAVMSFAIAGPWAANPDNREHTISDIDGKINTVMELTAGATVTSAAISMLPDDQCTPIANELAQMAKYFLVVLSALYLEKYMVTVSGYVAFQILIPLACLLGIVAIFKKSWREKMSLFAGKLIICALAVFMIVPASVKVSELIYENYSDSIEEVIDDATQIEKETEVESSAINRLTAWIAEKAETVRDFVADQLSKFVEALAIMVVTSCLIPILILLFFGWLMKVLFGLNMTTKIVTLPIQTSNE